LNKFLKSLLFSVTVLTFCLNSGLALAKDTVKPVISSVIASPSATSKIQQTITVSYKLSEKAKVTVQVFKGSTLLNVGIKNVSKASGKNSWVWKGSKATGDYFIKISAVDLAGNKSDLKVVTATVDTTVPKISEFEMYPDSNYFNSDDELYFNYVLSEKAKVIIRVYGGPFPEGYVISNTTNYAGENEFYWEGRIGSLIVPDGKYIITFTAIDSAGNQAKPHTIEVTKDSVEPVIKNFKADKEVLNPTTGKVKFSFEASEPVLWALIIRPKDEFMPVFFYPDEDGDTLVTSGTVEWDGNYAKETPNYDGDPKNGDPEFLTGPVPNGIYEYSLIVFDSAENYDMVTGTIKIDNAAQ
jgi:hypothetical protein